MDPILVIAAIVVGVIFLSWAFSPSLRSPQPLQHDRRDEVQKGMDRFLGI